MLFGVQPGPGAQAHDAVLLVCGNLRRTQYWPRRWICAGERRPVHARPRRGGRRRRGQAEQRSARERTRVAMGSRSSPCVTWAESQPASNTHNGGALLGRRRLSRSVIWSTATALAIGLGCTRWMSSGGVPLSRVKLRLASSWYAHPATIGCPVEWREGWEKKPRSGRASASQRGQTRESTAETKLVI
jgi:hypothetical protein